MGGFGRVMALAGALAGFSSTSVKADTIQFALHGERFSDGVLQGTFFGLADSGTSTPTAMSVTGTSYYDSYPSFSEYLGGSDFQTSGGFDIVNGQVVSGNFSFSDPKTHDQLTLDTVADSFSASIENKLFYLRPQDQPTEGGYMTYSLSAAPEPSVWILMLAGVGALGLKLKRTKKMTSIDTASAT